MQILFVDHSDTVRARVATGLFELVAEWNGFGRALYASACGVAAAEGPDPATTVALMAQASRLGIRPKLFAQQPEQFVYEDFDRCAHVACMHATPLLLPFERPGACLGCCSQDFNVCCSLSCSTFQEPVCACRSDIIVAVDDEVLKEVLAVAGGPSDQAWYNFCPCHMPTLDARCKRSIV